MRRLCSGGCGSAIPDGQRFCADCKPKPENPGDGIREHTNVARDALAHLYGSARWTRVAKQQLGQFPICERCRERLAEIADHVIPAKIFIALCAAEHRFLIADNAFFWMGNLQSLCRPCHSAKTAEDEAHVGEWPDLFANPRRPPKKWSF